MMEPPPRPHNPNPHTGATLPSKLLFWWANNVFEEGFKRPLEDVDIYDVLPEDSSIKLSNNLAREWEKELYKWKTGGRPSLYWALFKCYGPWVIAIGAVFFFEEGLRIAQAMCLALLVSYFEPGSSITVQQAYLYALGWALTYIAVTILDNLGFHKSFYYGLKIRVACTSLIYRKLLKLSQSAICQVSPSAIISLMTTEVHKFDQSCLGINYIWIGPLESLVVIVLLWTRLGLGPSCLVGVILIAVLVPAQLAMGNFLSKLRVNIGHHADRRIRIMSEVILGIRAIKLYCWEKPFMQLINAVRKLEMIFLEKMCHCRGMNSALYFVSGKVLMFGTFTTYILLGNRASASAIFSTLALYEILRASVCLLLPWGIQYYKEAMHAITRIQNFLLLEEKGLLDSQPQLNLGRAALPDNIMVRFEEYSGSWSKDPASLTLEDVSLSVQKSSLLLAILAELPSISGSVKYRGKLSFVPQFPWVFPGSIRENILFGSEFDKTRYLRVVQACLLVQDLEMLQDGDRSMIGDRHIILQPCVKTKITIARAIYQQGEVFLIDDPLANIDDKTALQIFTRCFCGTLGTKTIVMVTSQLRYIRAADRVAVMKQGRVSHCGTYADLKNLGVDFTELTDTTTEAETTPLIDMTDGLQSQGGQSEALPQYSSESHLDDIFLELKDSKEMPEAGGGEDLENNQVSWRVYLQYFQIGGGYVVPIIFIIVSLSAQVLYMLCDWWLYSWARHQFSGNGTVTSIRRISSRPSLQTSTSSFPSIQFYIYLGILGAFILSGFLRASIFTMIAVRACRLLHNNLFSSVLRAPLYFFEKFHAAQVLSRFARDVGIMDDPFPAGFFDCVQFLSLVLGAVLMAGVANYWLFILILPVLITFIYARYYYVSTAKEIKRLEIAARAPVYGHLANTLEGLWSIRAFLSEERFLRFYDIYQDRHTATCYMYLATNRWLAVRLDLLCVVFVTAIGFLAVVVGKTIDAGLLGLSMAYALNLMGLFQYSVRQSAEVESQMAAVNRIDKFSDLKPEAQPIVPNSRPPILWPQYGIVTCEGVTLLEGSEGTRMLKNIWCCIRAEEKVAILSRPDGCKRALVLALLRLVEPQGTVRIDGLDICDLGLQDLRDSITVIPQEPVLFGGSMRRNLDPFSRHPDAQLWKALEEVQLKEKVDSFPGKMYAEMSEFGPSFTPGQRLLLELARAILRNNKIIIIEEPSIVIGKKTEALVRHVIQNKFHNCTVITIAIRLSRVTEADRVMVIDEGRIKEFDPPHVLLQGKTGLFYKMVQQLDTEEANQLRRAAREKYENQPYKAPPQSLGGEMGMVTGNKNPRNFLPSFHSNRLTGVLNHFTGNRFSTNRF